MNFFGVIFIIVTVALLFLPLGLMIVKAYYHFEYLKKIHPDKYENYANYFSMYNFELFNSLRITLLFPFFKISPKMGQNVKLMDLTKKIRFFCRLTYYSIAFLLIYIIILVVFFGDFS